MRVYKNGRTWQLYGADQLTNDQLEQVVHDFLNMVIPDLNRVQIPVYKPIGGAYAYRAEDRASIETIDVVVFEIIAKNPTVMCRNENRTF